MGGSKTQMQIQNIIFLERFFNIVRWGIPPSHRFVLSECSPDFYLKLLFLNVDLEVNLSMDYSFQMLPGLFKTVHTKNWRVDVV